MHTQLEAYLEQVAAQLSALPPKRRNEELREMRQHLLNAVTVNQELGQSEEDAAANAVMQFGTAEDLGNNLVWAWRREETLNKKSLLGAIACTSVLLFTIPIIYTTLLGGLINLFMLRLERAYHWPGTAISALYFILGLPAYALIGAGSGRLFPRRAVLGTVLVTILWAVYQTAHLFYWNGLIYWPSKIIWGYLSGPTPFTAKDVVRMFVTNTLLGLVAATSATVTSRWWLSRLKQLWLAQY